MEIGFSLGSNLGDRQAQLSEAKRRMLDFDDASLAALSPLYDTEPVGVQPEYRDLVFLNAVIVLETAAAAQMWLQRLAEIERAMGRVRGEDRNKPRSIDIDILYAGDEYIDSGGLVVPHPRWAQRRFVVQPLADVRPDLTLPGVGLSVKEVLANLPSGEEVRQLSQTW